MIVLFAVLILFRHYHPQVSSSFAVYPHAW